MYTTDQTRSYLINKLNEGSWIENKNVTIEYPTFVSNSKKDIFFHQKPSQTTFVEITFENGEKIKGFAAISFKVEGINKPYIAYKKLDKDYSKSFSWTSMTPRFNTNEYFDLVVHMPYKEYIQHVAKSE